jgi:hypothetical protein
MVYENGTVMGASSFFFSGALFVLWLWSFVNAARITSMHHNTIAIAHLYLSCAMGMSRSRRREVGSTVSPPLSCREHSKKANLER